MSTKEQRIRVGHLLDGSGGPPQRDMVLTIRAGRFARIEPFTADMDRAGLTDLSRFTVLPPLVDCHLHLALDGTVSRRKTGLASAYPEVRAAMHRHLRYHFTHGVLAIRDGGDRHGHGLTLKRETVDLDQPVTVRTSGPAIYRRGRYGSLLGLPLDQVTDPLVTRLLRDPDTDHLKVINSGLNSLEEFGRPSRPQFNTEEMKELAAGCAAHGKKLMVHANGTEPVRIALKAGCASIEHGFFMGEENMHRMAGTGTVWVPTAITMRTLADPGLRLVDPARRTVARQTLAHQLEQLALARDCGVQVALGTDSGCPGVLHGESVSGELKLLRKAGYTIGEAVRCATVNGARLLGLDHPHRIDEGIAAHFLVVRATPADLPRKLFFLERLYLHGQPCAITPEYRR